jgi:hypothetical protein
VAVVDVADVSEEHFSFIFSFKMYQSEQILKENFPEWQTRYQPSLSASTCKHFLTLTNLKIVTDHSSLVRGSCWKFDNTLDEIFAVFTKFANFNIT